ncbi:zinc finger protein 75A-like [Drosophila suzukii]|uniref:Zinc finger protein 75A-like n=1 Tax=Drosophila suzukii TaxID=28584 RepID=A0AB40DLM5_DROSZ
MALSKLCRVCLKEKDCMINLFVEDKQEPTLAALLCECSGCSVVKTDGKPQFICLLCAEATRSAFRLIRLAWASDLHLDLLRLKDNDDQAGQGPSTITKEEVDLPEDAQSAEWDYQPGAFPNSPPSCSTMQEKAAGDDLGQDEQNPTLEDQFLGFDYSPRRPNSEDWQEMNLSEAPDDQSAGFSYPPISDHSEQGEDEDQDQEVVGFAYSPITNHSEQGEEKEEEHLPEDQPKSSKSAKAKPKRKPMPKRKRKSKAKHSRPAKTEKNFCKHCSKFFKNLDSHAQKHKTEGRFWCPTCAKFYVNKSSLTSHNRTHTGERPFTCAHCDSNFRQSGSLLKHVRDMHPQKYPYVCKLCPFGSTRMTDLKNHIKFRHRNES